jgi:hypothetical protein
MVRKIRGRVIPNLRSRAAGSKQPGKDFFWLAVLSQIPHGTCSKQHRVRTVTTSPRKDGASFVSLQKPRDKGNTTCKSSFLVK